MRVVRPAVLILLTLFLFTSTPGAAGQAPWQGQLRLAPDARFFTDDGGGPVLPLCAHFGEAFSAYVRQPEAVVQQLGAIKAGGYDCVRVWIHLGYHAEAWRGREVTPFRVANSAGATVDPTPGYYEKLEAFLREVQGAGLTVQLSQGDFGGFDPVVPLNDVVVHGARVAGVVDRVGRPVVALAEALNEAWQNGGFDPPALRRIVEPFRVRGVLTALSAPPASGLAPRELAQFAGDIFYVHGMRGGKAEDRLRSILDLGLARHRGLPRLGWQGEPTGPGAHVTVGRVDDAEELALLAAQSWIARQAWTYMSSHGVLWKGPIESQPGFRAVAAMRQALARAAPDVMAWRLADGRGDAVLRPVPNADGSVAEIGQAFDDQRGAAVVFGGNGRATLKNQGTCTLDVTVVTVNPDETLREEHSRLAPGEQGSLEYRVGRLLLGRCVEG